MTPAEKQEVLNQAKAMEKHGRIDLAVQRLAEAGLLEDAARMLSGQRRFAEAAALLVGRLGVPFAQVNTLNAEGKKLALMAAICLVKAGDPKPGVELFMALREYERAAEVLEKMGDMAGAVKARLMADKKGASVPGAAGGSLGVGGGTMSLDQAKKFEQQGKLDLALQAYIQLRRLGDAGRMAAQLGRLGDAAGFFAEGGLVYEAGTAYLQLGDTGKALDNLVRVARNDPRYRQAAVDVARLANELNHVSLRADNFLDQFIKSGPTGPREEEALYLLAKLYARNDLAENAKEALRQLVSRNPGYRDAAAALQQLEAESKAASAQMGRVLKEEAASQRAEVEHRQPRATMNDLPPLPDLPDLPPLPGRRAPAVQATQSGVARVPTVSAVPSAIAASRPTELQQSGPGEVSRQVGDDVERIARDLHQGGAAPSAAPAASTGNTLFVAGVSGAVAQGMVPAPAVAAPVSQAPLSPAQLSVGMVLSERYRLEKQIGRGGMAVVFKATDLELGEEIALKVFTQAPEDEKALARFRQELQLSRQLVHTNIVRLFDIGVFRGLRFITMELLVGHTLKDELTKPMDPARTISLLLQACAGLQAAHHKGIIHRDIKPENLFLIEDGTLKVMDFGIAKGQVTKGLTMEGMAAGTPDYMSPEQISNFTAVGPPSDLYSLGIVAYEMLTGRVPFQSPELMPLLMMHLNEAPRPPSSINPNVPAQLEEVVLKLLAKKKEDRFADCRGLAQALVMCRSS